MDRDIKDLDCSKMSIHPKSPQLVTFLEKSIPQLKRFTDFDKKSFTKSQVLRYILFMFDPHSPVQKMSSLDWWGQKWEACAYAGFPQKKSRHDGQLRFDERVLDMVLGKDKDVDDMILLFNKWTDVKEWDYVVYLNEAMAGHVLSAMKSKQDIKSIKEVNLLWKEKTILEKKLSRGDVESDEFVSRFYHQIEQSRLSVRPEDYADKLASGDDLRGDSPYNVSYTVQQLKFIGDKMPDDE